MKEKIKAMQLDGLALPITRLYGRDNRVLAMRLSTALMLEGMQNIGDIANKRPDEICRLRILASLGLRTRLKIVGRINTVLECHGLHLGMERIQIEKRGAEASRPAVAELGIIASRIGRHLRAAGIRHTFELVRIGENEFLRLSRFPTWETTLPLTKARLAAYGLSLGMQIDEGMVSELQKVPTVEGILTPVRVIEMINRARAELTSIEDFPNTFLLLEALNVVLK